MEKKARKQSTVLSRCLKAPFRMLTKARDFYVQSMTQCGGRMVYGGAMSGPAAQVSTLPKSFSVGSTRSSRDDDLSELIRAASTRNLSNKVQLELLRRRQPPATDVKVVPRSHSVGIGSIGRIDEDKSCEFGEDMIKVNTDKIIPRSRSHAVASRRSSIII